MNNLSFRSSDAIQYDVNINTFVTNDIENMKLMLLMSKDHDRVSFFHIIEGIMKREYKIKH